MKTKIEQLEQQLAELKAEFEKSQKPEQLEKWQDKLLQPSEGDYFYISSDVNHGFTVEESFREDVQPEHAFRTEEQAELVKEKMLLMQEMLAFAHVRNEGKNPDWDDDNELKHGILHNGFNEFNINEFKVGESYYYNYFVFGISVKSEEIAEEMFEIFGERIEKYYNVQY